MAHPRLAQIQERYNHCCGYCGVSETDTGSELTVDHYDPVSAGGDDSDENLVYACMRCNQHKGAALPFTAGITPDRRILHPLHDDFAAHIEEDESGWLSGRTATGIFHIQVLHLNRPALIANRRRKHLDVLREARLEQALALNAEMLARIERRENYIASLEKRLKNLEEREA